MTHHINNVCKSASHAIRNIGRIRKYLGKGDCEKLIHAFATFRLDCCNSILYGLPMSELSKLQRLQNTAADHITPVLRNLHWLPVQSRITYKILLLTYKALNGMAPVYISELLHIYKPSRSLRSANQNLLVIRRSNTATYGDRTFPICAPKPWNSLPATIRGTQSLRNFRSQLKTYLF